MKQFQKVFSKRALSEAEYTLMIILEDVMCHGLTPMWDIDHYIVDEDLGRRGIWRVLVVKDERVLVRRISGSSRRIRPTTSGSKLTEMLNPFLRLI